MNPRRQLDREVKQALSSRQGMFIHSLLDRMEAAFERQLALYDTGNLSEEVQAALLEITKMEGEVSCLERALRINFDNPDIDWEEEGKLYERLHNLQMLMKERKGIIDATKQLNL